MANTKEFRDTKVSSIEASVVPGRLILTVVQESPFAGFADSGVEHKITLFSRRNNEIDEQSIERTQATLREQLGDENIIFTDPSVVSADPNHIINWVAAHKGAAVGLVTQNENGFFDLGEGLTGGGSFGDSNYLRGYKASDGSYDPKQHRVAFYDALSARQKEAVDTLDATRFPEIQTSARSAYKGIVLPGVVTDVILSRANAFGATPEKYSRADVRDEIVDTLSSGKKPVAENQALAKQIEALPADFAYVDLLRILGGSSAENVRGTKQGSISGLLENVDRTSVRFYIQNPETGYIFQSTDLKAGGNTQTLNSQNNVQFEFLTDDFSQSDLVRFLSNIAGLQGTDFGIDQLFAVAVEEKIFDKENGVFNVADMNELVGALRTWFVGRTVEVQSTLFSTARGAQDKDKLGTNIRSVSATKDVDAIQSSLIVNAAPSDITIGATAASVDATPANPFAAAATAPKEAEVAANPFAVEEIVAVEEVVEVIIEKDVVVEVEVEEAVIEEPTTTVVKPAAVVEEPVVDEDDEDLTSNPFI